eukprot:8431824-Pyramimonas_sp.AAC.1
MRGVLHRRRGWREVAASCRWQCVVPPHGRLPTRPVRRVHDYEGQSCGLVAIRSTCMRPMHLNVLALFPHLI